jgi:hypothetical protein
MEELAETIAGVARGKLSCPPLVATALLRHVGAGGPGPLELIADYYSFAWYNMNVLPPIAKEKM